MTTYKFPLVVIGSQWGDEGKGKLVDLLAQESDFVVRFNGGNNAGHTVVVDGVKYPLSLVPSGVLQKKKLIIAQGVVIDADVLLNEIRSLEDKGIKVDITVDYRCHMVLPYHKVLDASTEKSKGKNAIGSLHKGIGYTYEDKNNRNGIRLIDLTDAKTLKPRLERNFKYAKLRVEKVFDFQMDLKFEQVYKEALKIGKALKPYMADTSAIIRKNMEKKKILFEGAHGSMLDPVFGSYPYAVAINTISGAVFPFVGIPPQKLYTIGIVKAYTTRVGNGPFPTEQDNKIGEYMRERGHEIGTVSKRNRRCGWLDLPLLKSMTELSGYDYIAITKLDVLSGLDKLQVCTHYLDASGKKHKEIPMLRDISDIKPVYKEFGGWQEDITKVKKFDDLPKAAQSYIKFIEEYLNVPISMISVGPARGQEINI